MYCFLASRLFFFCSLNNYCTAQWDQCLAKKQCSTEGYKCLCAFMQNKKSTPSITVQFEIEIMFENGTVPSGV